MTLSNTITMTRHRFLKAGLPVPTEVVFNEADIDVVEDFLARERPLYESMAKPLFRQFEIDGDVWRSAQVEGITLRWLVYRRQKTPVGPNVPQLAPFGRRDPKGALS